MSRLSWGNLRISTIGELGSETPIEPESLDTIIKIVNERQRNEKPPLVTLVPDERALQEIWSASSLEIGSKQCLAVCRIARYFSLAAFQDFIAEIQNTLDQYKGITDKFDSAAQVTEIFSLPAQVSAKIFDQEVLAQIDKKLTTPLKVLQGITESQLAKINPIPIATGFLVGGNHLLTNYHVLPSQEIAEQCVAQFNYIEDVQGYTQKTTDYEFDPKTLFVDNPNLDYTLVQLKNDIFARQAGYNFGWIELIEDDQSVKPGLTWVEINYSGSQIASLEDLSKKNIENIKRKGFTVEINETSQNSVIIIWHSENNYKEIEAELKELENLHQAQKKLVRNGFGDLIIIVQHPQGKQKKIDLSNNKINDNGLYKNFLRYEANSDYGSSGSPVFNSQWHLVALHHEVITKKQENSDQSMNIIAQQGVRICRIVEDLKKKSTSNPKLASFIEDFVVTSEQLNYPPFSSSIEFDGVNDLVVLDREIAFVSCSSDSRSNNSSGNIKFWNRQGIPLKTLNHTNVTHVQFNPTGEILASATGYFSESNIVNNIKLWLVSDGTCIFTLPLSSEEGVKSLNFSPADGSILASTHQSNTVKFWYLKDIELLNNNVEKQPIQTLTGYKFSFSPDGKNFALATSWDSSIEIWSLEENKFEKKKTLNGNYRCVELKFSSDGKTLAAADIDCNIYLFKIDTEELDNPFDTFRCDGQILGIHFNSNGTTLTAIAQTATVTTWKVQIEASGDEKLQSSVQLKTELSGNDSSDSIFMNTDSVSFSADGQNLITINHKPNIKLWSLKDGTFIRSLKHNELSGELASVEFSESFFNWESDVSFNPKFNQALDIVESEGFQPFTVEVLVNPLGGAGTIISSDLPRVESRDICGFNLSIRYVENSEGYLEFIQYGSNSYSRRSLTSIPIDKYTHIAITFNQEEVIIYVNGQPFYGPISKGVEFFSRSLALMGASLGESRSNQCVIDFFKGIIAEVRFWKVNRSESQIKEYMFRRLDPETINGEELIGYWQFEEDQGDKVYNLAVKDDYALISGAKFLRASQYPALPMPFGLRFNEDEKDSRIECSTNNLDTRDAITIEAWVKHKFGNCLIVSRGGIVSSDRKVNRGYSLAWVDGKIRVALSNETSQIVVYSQDNAPRDRIWHHVAFSWDKNSQEVALYIDGRRQNSLIEGQSETIFSEGQYKTIGLFSGDLDSLTEPLIIGRNASEGSYYDMAIAEVRLWNIARPQDLIKSKMSQRLKRDETGLIGYWRLDDGGEYNDQVLDLSSKQNHGKIHGTIQWFPPIPPPIQSQDLNATS